MKTILFLVLMLTASIAAQAAQEQKQRISFIALVSDQPAWSSVDWLIKRIDRKTIAEPIQDKRWQFVEDLPPGKYQVTARLNDQTKTVEIEILDSGEQEVKIDFGL